MNTLSQSRRWGWIGGWAVPPGHFAELAGRCWPEDRHTVFAPTTHALAQIQAGDFDVVAGYSLGGLILLSADPGLESLPAPLIVAPILGFDREADFGGTCLRAHRLAIRGKFDQNPLVALRLFQRLTGLALHDGPLPYAAEDLAWGLDALGTLRARPENIRRAFVYVGETDPLVALPRLSSNLASHRILPGIGHDYCQLLPEMAQHEHTRAHLRPPRV